MAVIPTQSLRVHAKILGFHVWFYCGEHFYMGDYESSRLHEFAIKHIRANVNINEIECFDVTECDNTLVYSYLCEPKEDVADVADVAPADADVAPAVELSINDAIINSGLFD